MRYATLLLPAAISISAVSCTDQSPTGPATQVSSLSSVVTTPSSGPWARIGCSTGEEVYSMAILLREEGLYERARIYATDINEVVLQRAKAGIFPLERMQEYTDNYIRAGGKRSFSEYYTAKYGGALFDQSLTKNVSIRSCRSFMKQHTRRWRARLTCSFSALCPPMATAIFPRPPWLDRSRHSSIG